MRRHTQRLTATQSRAHSAAPSIGVRVKTVRALVRVRALPCENASVCAHAMCLSEEEEEEEENRVIIPFFCVA